MPSQPSLVHGFLSSQLTPLPPTHDPPRHKSLVVQAFLSSHGAELLKCWQPTPGAHLSSVHKLPSSQLSALTPPHVPPVQVSWVVQMLPSSQVEVLLTCTQPPVALQLSVVQTLLSSQFTLVEPAHTPPLHVSPLVQALLSSHPLALPVCWQPSTGSQLSLVQPFRSSQLAAPLPTQVPALQ